MVFEIYEKGQSWGHVGRSDEISITKTSISFGTDSLSQFGEEEFVEVYLDRKNNKVGFKSTTDNVTGFRIGKKVNKTGRRVSTGKFIKLLPQGKFKMRVEDGFVVIDVPEIVDDTKTVKL